ncbi:MAG TPA: 23S rRNA (pseudouridine(1915)-N(3))-methyltransferase RlmH [Thermoanaerobaculia bacterium]|nr:23S rRNA (pseudouridine(1915)-N(3))-methyltransferase RlmH [Thermoanaerobaculia bacterium]
MARELVIVWAGRHHRSGWEEICTSYRRRISHMATVRDLPVKAKAASEDPQRMKIEGQALLAALPRPSYSIALDSRGEIVDSLQLAERLTRIKAEWPHPVAFLIGSDLGLDRTVLDEARWVLSLGRLTLSHELARVVLYEQLYRTLTIEAGMSYHREPL